MESALEVLSRAATMVNTNTGTFHTSFALVFFSSNGCLLKPIQLNSFQLECALILETIDFFFSVDYIIGNFVTFRLDVMC